MGTLLSDTPGWKENPTRLLVLPHVERYMRERGRAAETAAPQNAEAPTRRRPLGLHQLAVLGNLLRLSKLAALKRGRGPRV